MESPHKAPEKPDARFHLANERTLLAWIRSGIALMAFGFVVVKFSLFLKQIAFLSEGKISIPTQGYSSMLGVGLVVIGAVTIFFGYLKYRQTGKQLLSDTYKPGFGLVTVLTFLLLMTSFFLILYLVNNS